MLVILGSQMGQSFPLRNKKQLLVQLEQKYGPVVPIPYLYHKSSTSFFYECFTLS